MLTLGSYLSLCLSILWLSVKDLLENSPTSLLFLDIFRSSWNLLLLLNVSIVSLLILGVVVVYTLFKELRDTEIEKAKKEMFEFTVFRLVFMGSVLEPEMRELFVWSNWFFLHGFIRFFIIIALERFSVVGERRLNRYELKTLTFLLCFLILFTIILALLCVNLLNEAGISLLSILLFESLFAGIGLVS
jgi:hypothetical protein